MAAVDDTELNLGEKKKKKKKKVVLEDAVSTSLVQLLQRQRHQQSLSMHSHSCSRPVSVHQAHPGARCSNSKVDCVCLIHAQDAMLGEDGSAPADEAEPAGDLDLGLTKKKKKKKPKVRQ